MPKRNANGQRGRFAITPQVDAESAATPTVELTGMQVHRCAGLLRDQLYEAVQDLSVYVETEEATSDELTAAIERLTVLRDRLAVIDPDKPGMSFEDPIEVPIAWLFPQLEAVR